MKDTHTDEARDARVFSPLVFVLTGYCHANGVDPQPALDRNGITPEHFADPETRVPYDALIDLWDALVTAHPGRPLGLEYAAQMDMAAFGLYALLGIHSEDLGTSIRRSIRFQRLFDPMITIELTPVAGTDLHEITLRHVVEDTHPEVLEMMMAAMCLHTQRQLGELDQEAVRGDPRFEAWFKHPMRHPLEEYTSRLDATLRFGAPRFAVRIPSAWLALPFVRATPGVSLYLERALLAHEEADARDATFASRVRAEIERRLADGEVDQEAVARALTVSLRTMQRRLKEDETTFAALLESARRERAHELLTRTELPIYAIACALGYSEPSTFYRAFKRWFDVTPQQLRSGTS